MQVSAVSWFERSNWAEIKRLCADDLQDTYDEWLAAAEAGVENCRRNGLLCEKVFLKPDDIRNFQRAGGRKVNGRDRAEIAARKLAESKHGGASKRP